VPATFPFGTVLDRGNVNVLVQIKRWNAHS